MIRSSRPVLFLLAFTGCVALLSCTLTVTRPVQDMSDTSAAIRAAKEVQADTLAPELYRQANEWWLKARKAYKFKDFYYAQQDAMRARKYAEEAEFEAIKNGGNRTDISPVDQAAQAAPVATPTPEDYPTPQGTPADVYDERKAAADAQQAAQQKAAQQEENSIFTGGISNPGSGTGSSPGTMISPPPLYGNQFGTTGQLPVPTASH